MTKSVNTTQLDLMFAQLRANVKNTYPVMRQLSGDMLNAVEENFEKEGRLPKWKRLSSVTKGIRDKKGYTGKMLENTGQLKASMITRNTSNTSMVGTNKVYAATMQFGAKKGQYGKDKHGRPIPWGRVPARPFLKFTPRDIKKFSKTVLEHLTND